VLDKFVEYVYLIFRGGTRGFNEAEMNILLSVLESLPNRDKSILKTQIESINFVQRQHPGRLVVAYYGNKENVPRLPYLASEHCLAKVIYNSGNKKRVTSLILHKGRFMSFERNVPQVSSEIDSILKIKLHPDGLSSVTEEIDAEEHRKNA